MKHLRNYVVLILAVVLLFQCAVPVYAQSGYTMHKGSLLDTSLILEGQEHVTVNPDGSWTVTGDFVLACPIDFDYRISTYAFVFSAVTDGTFDFEFDFSTDSPNTKEVLLSDTLYYRPFGYEGVASYDPYYSIYLDNYVDAILPANYRFQSTKLIFHAYSATSVTFKELSIEHPLPPSTPGDVNRDGLTDTADVRLMLLGLSDDSRHLRNVDVDGNDCFDSRDVRALLNRMM